MIRDSVLRYIGVEGATHVLDPALRERMLGIPTTIRRIRIKPGRSLLVSWTLDEPARALWGAARLAGHGWMALLTSPDKAAGILRRAARGGGEVAVHHQFPWLVSGGIASDPRLARPLARALKRVDESARVDVVRYNPSRRVILRVRGTGVPGGDAMVRIDPKGLASMVETERTWHGQGIPVLLHEPWGRRGTAAVVPFWGVGDLASTGDTAAARAAGRAVARIHGLGTIGRDSQARFNPDGGLPEQVGTITALVPELGDRAERLAARLRAAGKAGNRAAGALHGDLTPDQILTDGARIRIIDLDRARVGDRAEDLGMWCAGCRLLGAPELETAFLEGYARVRDIPELGAWIGWALMAKALEPFRQVHPRWPREIEGRLALVERALNEEDRRN